MPSGMVYVNGHSRARVTGPALIGALPLLEVGARRRIMDVTGDSWVRAVVVAASRSCGVERGPWTDRMSFSALLGLPGPSTTPVAVLFPNGTATASPTVGSVLPV